MNNDPFSYLGGFASSGVKKGVDRPKVTTVGMKVKRPPEYPSRTPSGDKDGNQRSAGNVPKTSKPGRSYVEEPSSMKGMANKDGWSNKPNTRSAKGKETEMAQPDSPGDKKAKAASPSAKSVKEHDVVETNAKDSKAHAAKRTGAKKANIEGNESPMYEKLEKKSLRSLKGGGTEKELREGHNEKWIAGAIKRPGAFTAKAKAAGKGVQEYASEKSSAPGRLGKQARLAKTLSKMRKK